MTKYYIERKNEPPTKFGNKTFKWARVNWPGSQDLEQARYWKDIFDHDFKKVTHRIIKVVTVKTVKSKVVK